MPSSKRRAPSRRDGIARRDALLDAALRCFFARGISQTRIDDIRQESGASPSSIYHQFEGVAGLTLALLQRTFTRLFAHLASRCGATDTPEALVRALVDGHIEWVLGHREEAAVMYQAMSLGFDDDDATALGAHKTAALQPVMERFVGFIVDGQIPAWTPLEMEIVVLGSAHEACRRLLAGAPVDETWMRATLPRLAWRSIQEGRDATMK